MPLKPTPDGVTWVVELFCRTGSGAVGVGPNGCGSNGLTRCSIAAPAGACVIGATGLLCPETLSESDRDSGADRESGAERAPWTGYSDTIASAASWCNPRRRTTLCGITNPPACYDPISSTR